MHSTNVKNLYSKANNKKELVLLVADHFNMNPMSVSNHWFSGFCQVPEKHEARCIKIMQNFIKVQESESQVLTH